MPKDFFLNEWNFFEKERIFLNPSTKQIVSLYGFRTLSKICGSDS
ncbi:hypothetical protein LEP1GSC016_0506 [Leptospira borgpetersenii serovar Hardjo-bovis str. Sponselee]|uniref:Uncharacterized protein n=7 Tax=Leptospira borgpetersenii TaxID=174 RepID=M3FE13_LEPBO|nr:hypothetical protein LBBP_03986 [Leptospira borgpetersenii serovar Ballum]EKP12953.1 hypothetical protein LEP1GSC128_3689 [Leptospira borgpetersenii str. 200801926]EKQ91068.1 hypothetical protein LEP1GSC101_0860 [Leptospira borgpetersenii str. UI 09149]EKR01716.1 hypothetical protein LEP1GSC121_0233 [Leptospira borgpetersenii serovar Castellonis str. 200801910]EMG00093.1 hypothetical protein LEP1GSC123_2038 [Leptospira borgpetersenii str. 200701203]EMJ84123.1 hypothetical protein LEP1GSC016